MDIDDISFDESGVRSDVSTFSAAIVVVGFVGAIALCVLGIILNLLS